MHTIINNNNWYNVGPKGQIEWFNKNSRIQFGIEGIILSFLMISTGVIFVVLIGIIKKFEMGRL